MTRLYWNEFYVDPMAAPEFERCPSAQRYAESAEFLAEKARLAKEPHVDYRATMTLRRSLIERMSGFVDAVGPERVAALQRFIAANPDVLDYAKFRAVCERQNRGAPAWPEPLRSGTLTAEDYDPLAAQTYVYAQFVAVEQLAMAREKALSAGTHFFLDYPLGVHPDGYDTWRYREAFAWGVGGGAPPDSLFTAGQSWGFPPLKPNGLRESGYRYLRDVLSHLMPFCGVLRIDHLMGFHRLFVVPNGFAATDGAYVKYPADEFYAVFCIASHRHQCMLVGEDLGTVPESIRGKMQEHGVRRIGVVQFDLTPHEAGILDRVPKHSAACLNTHDTVPFAAWWKGDDAADQVDLGLIDEWAAESIRAYRGRVRAAIAAEFGEALEEVASEEVAPEEVAPEDVAIAIVCGLLKRDVSFVTINVEDLWGETQSQNWPGTTRERPNWKRKVRLAMEVLVSDEQVLRALRRVREADAP